MKPASMPLYPAVAAAQITPGPVAASASKTSRGSVVRQKVALVTGASGGLGRAIAEHLAEAGWRVFAASRRVDGWTADGGPPPRIVPVVMDVTSDASVSEALARLTRESNYLDLVVNNAGYGVAGAVEETPLDAAHAQFETNFFGTARVCRQVSAPMRRQGGGTIVNITSIGGRLGLPYQGYYSASKFAVEGLTEALRYEMEPFGVRVCSLAPGNFRTDFDQHRHVFGLDSASPYTERGRRVLDGMAADEAEGAPPHAAARAVLRLAEARRPPLHSSVGPWLERLGLMCCALLPRFVFDWGYRRIMRM